MDGDGIDVEKLMRQVREKADKKNVSPPSTRESATKAPEPVVSDRIKADHDYLHENWNVGKSDYSIESHRMLAGPVLVKGRQLINGEVRRYVDPMFARQTWFNAGLLRYLEGSLEAADVRMNAISHEMERKLSDQEDDLQDLIRRSDEDTAYLKTSLQKAIRESEKCPLLVKAEVHSAMTAIDEDLNKKAWLAAILEERADKAYGDHADTAVENAADINYLDFENNFRGTMDEIRQRQSAFVDHYGGRSNVLDIGCGRGEFLELMRRNGIVARGIDVDGDMVRYCESRGLNAKKADAMEYLGSLEDGSLDGIFCDQVIEHLEPGYLVRMLRLCNRKLKDGSPFIVETVNPTSFTSFANFYIDMTHQRPLHPATLEYLIRASDFKDIEVKFISPVHDNLKKISVDASMPEKEKEAFTVYNDNIDRLNKVLFGAQDYYVVSRK